MQKKGIRRLLRRKDTLEYFKGDGWTNNPKEAATFSDVAEAAQICAQHGLVNIELALQVENEAPEVFCTAIR
ncbi:MAG TPA: hypothetical protein VN578_06985 [Candidatus Binatia bacterium]|nr:hypothetical protein [Candidatus Binatia bacterium]